MTGLAKVKSALWRGFKVLFALLLAMFCGVFTQEDTRAFEASYGLHGILFVLERCLHSCFASRFAPSCGWLSALPLSFFEFRFLS